MIAPQQLIDLFVFALANMWGYIYGGSGQMWTEALQKQKVNYMIANFGSDWKTDHEAKKNKYYLSALYGSKWIGHNVADCSGLFRWAFKQFGIAVSHSSNTLWRSYCSSKGSLSKGKRTDGKPLLNGTAVFVNKSGNRTHIGLYVGDGKVIEASGTKVGVIESKITDSKWNEWGELKNVDYSKNDDQKGDDDPVADVKPTLRKGSKGEYVTLLQTKLFQLGYDLGKYGVDGDFGSATEKAVKAFQKAHGLTQDGVVGTRTWAELDKAEEPVKKYTIIVPNLTEDEADDLLGRYKSAYLMEG